MPKRDKGRPDSPAKLQKYLAGIDYPVDKPHLRATAEKNGAPGEILKLIDRLPGDRYDAPTAVMKAFGEIR